MRWSEVAQVCGVHPRTFFDWRRGRYTLPYNAYRTLTRIGGFELDRSRMKTLPDFWSVHRAARIGGLTVAKRYGGPGTPEGRRRGGRVSQLRRRLYPERYSHCNIRKTITQPLDCNALAEFIGIVLGDGGIGSKFQVVITLHREHDRQYQKFVSDLIQKLFGVNAAIYRYRSPRSKHVIGVVCSSAALVEYLLHKGLHGGNKTHQQVRVPAWIGRDPEFSKACLRGLVDTDGGVYDHRHSSRGYESYNIGLTFSNHSVPLLRFVERTLEQQGFSAKRTGHGVALYRESEVVRYTKEIRFHNPYHERRLRGFLRKKYSRRDAPNWVEAF